MRRFIPQQETSDKIVGNIRSVCRILFLELKVLEK